MCVGVVLLWRGDRWGVVGGWGGYNGVGGLYVVVVLGVIRGLVGGGCGGYFWGMRRRGLGVMFLFSGVGVWVEWLDWGMEEDFVVLGGGWGSVLFVDGVCCVVSVVWVVGGGGLVGVGG